LKHKAASSFWICYEKLPLDIRGLADKNFKLLKTDPSHPSLQFKKVGKVWSGLVVLAHITEILPHPLKAVFFGFGLALMPNMTSCLPNAG